MTVLQTDQPTIHPSILPMGYEVTCTSLKRRCFHSSFKTCLIFLVKTIVFLTGHSVAGYVHLLASLTQLIRYAHSVHGLAHSRRSLPHGTVKIREYVFTL